MKLLVRSSADLHNPFTMRMVITVLGWLCLLTALYVMVANWACAIGSLRNKRNGIDRHHSMVPVVSLVLSSCSVFMLPRWPGMWALVIPALDIANLNLLFSPVYLIVYLFRKRGSDRKAKN